MHPGLPTVLWILKNQIVDKLFHSKKFLADKLLVAGLPTWSVSTKTSHWHTFDLKFWNIQSSSISLLFWKMLWLLTLIGYQVSYSLSCFYQRLELNIHDLLCRLFVMYQLKMVTKTRMYYNSWCHFSTNIISNLPILTVQQNNANGALIIICVVIHQIITHADLSSHFLVVWLHNFNRQLLIWV